MKKSLLISFAILLVMCTALLLGCVPEETPETPALYWNADKDTERTAEADGSYQAMFILDGQHVTLRIPNEEMMQRIDKQAALGLAVDSTGTVTDYTVIADMPQCYLGLHYYVQSFGGKTLKMNSEPTFDGKAVVLTYEESTKILDVSDFAASKGEATQLQKGDGITVIANADGTVDTIYVDERQGIYTTEKRFCPLCETEVDFTNWFSSANMPFSSGHYYLEKDIELTMSTPVNSGDITLDLNGKTVTMVNEGQRFYTLGEQVILNVIDTVGNGRAVVASAGKGPSQSGMFVYMSGYGCEFNMYSGTIDASNAVCRHGGVVDNYNGTFNMYGGTLLGASTYGVGGGAIIVQNHVNIYGGEIIGGSCAEYNIVDDNPPGGGCIRHNGITNILNIYGGTIRDGSSKYNGGGIYINGPLNLYGGTITGCSAEQAGGGIWVGPGGSINLAGDVTITDNEGGNIYLTDGKKITVAEEGLGEINIGIEMEKPDTFTSNAVAKDKVSGFIGDSGKVSQKADGKLALN